MTSIKIGFIGGSGLNNPDILKKSVEKTVTTPFGSPSDVLIEGQIDGVDVVLLARHGRKHTINPSNVNYRANIWALHSVGCTHVIVSTATGSLREDIKPGDLVLVTSFIDRTKSRIQTFYDGKTPGFENVCHIPMEPAFCLKTQKVILRAAQELKFDIHPEGIAVTIEGPRFSSKAESNLYRSWGAHLVNMTLVPEVCLAKELGLSYAAIAMATDYDCWHNSVVDVPTVLANFAKNVDKIQKLFVGIVPLIKAENWEDVINKNKECVTNSVMVPQGSK